MAGTRTVYRGSKGQFAGASRGKAEKVRVGRRSISGTRATSGAARPRAQKSRVRAVLDKRAAARQASNVKPLNPNVKPRSRPAPKTHGIVRAAKGSSRAGKVKFARNVAIGVGVGAGAGYLAGRAIKRGSRVPIPPGSGRLSGNFTTPGNRRYAPQPRNSPNYRGLGVGRREVVNMPRSPLRHDAIVGGRSVSSGAFVGSVGKAARAAAGKKTGPNYSLAKGKKEYVGRRLKPGEGRGFKMATGKRR